MLVLVLLRQMEPKVCSTHTPTAIAEVVQAVVVVVLRPMSRQTESKVNSDRTPPAMVVLPMRIVVLRMDLMGRSTLALVWRARLQVTSNVN
jgi:hypothetical protein